MEEPSFGLVLVVLAVLLLAGFAYDFYWWLIERFARKFDRKLWIVAPSAARMTVLKTIDGSIAGP